MGKAEHHPDIADDVPCADAITDYDRAMFPIYLRLLDAEADGASPQDMARVILGIDPEREPQRARQATASHLKRAQWMTQQGYRHLLKRD